MKTAARLYHVCPESSLGAILEEGLDPEQSQSSLKAVFLTNDRFTAVNYANMRPGEAHALLSVDLDALDTELLGPDNYELPGILQEMTPEELEDIGYWEGVDWNDVSWQDSLAICCQVTYHGRIPPIAIKIEARGIHAGLVFDEEADEFPRP